MTIFVAILGLIFLIVIHELGHMLTAKALGVRVPEFGIGFGPAIFKKKFGETVYSFRIILLGGFAKMAGMEDIGSVAQQKGELGPDTYPSKAPWKRALIIFAGPGVNIAACVLILAGTYLVAGAATATTEVDEVVPETFAAEAGVEAGDRLVGLNGSGINDWQTFQERVAGKEPGQNVTLAVERGGERLTFDGKLSENPGAEGQALVGVQPVAEITNYGLLGSLGLGVQQTVNFTTLYAGGIYQLITGQMDFFDNVSGPVGIVGASSELVSQGVYIRFLAIISLILGITNLLPILPLDGGHLLFIAVEKVIGRPVSQQTMGKIAFLGLALFMTLFLFATYADISKIIEGQPFIPK
ncbi:MAG: M50 family metallopeptidase [Rubrobacteraceae bacterium]